MSLTFLNNGMGPGAGGCYGQSHLNCNNDGNCGDANRPICMSNNSNTSFTPFSKFQKRTWHKTKIMPLLKQSPVYHRITPNGIGVI